jgi:predicted pyridoxine 5'-phosphate oxidase superfamily flavin-nucleotide-binding protein
LGLKITQSFGNCKKHITERILTPVAPRSAHPYTTSSLDARPVALIESSDTFFIGSGVDSFGLDASHRGGAPGFVRVTSPHSLTFPDYSGNSFFNTIGNLLRDARVALLFLDFEGGDLLHVLGRATIDWGSLAITQFPGAARLIAVEVEEVIFRPGAWGLTTSSPKD